MGHLPKQAGLFFGLVSKRVVLQMGLLAPLLLVGALLEEPGCPGDRGADARQRRRVDVQQQAGQTAPRGGGGRRPGSRPRDRVARRRRGPVRNPVVHQQADFGVREEVAGFDALCVCRHDDHGPVVRGGAGVGRQEGVVH